MTVVHAYCLRAHIPDAGPISELPPASVYDLLALGVVAFAVVAIFLAAVLTFGRLLDR